MNRTLYNQIKTYLVEKNVGTESIRSLLNEKMEENNKTAEGIFTVIYAFYEYMNSRSSIFYFVKDDEWTAFFKKNLSSYLTLDKINLIFDDVINDKTFINMVLNVCEDEVKKNLYFCAKNRSSVNNLSNGNKYKDAFNYIEKELVKQGLVKETNQLINYESEKSIDEESEIITKNMTSLNREKKENNKTDKQDDLSSKASGITDFNSIGLSKETDNDGSLELNGIILEQELVDKLTSSKTKVATNPKNVFDKMKKRALNALMLLTVNLEIVEGESLNASQIISKRSDKTASSDKGVLRKIFNSLREKINLSHQLVKPSSEISKTLKNMLKETNQKFISSFKSTFNKSKALYGKSMNNNLNETYGYITMPDGQIKKLIVKSGTKAGQLSSFKEPVRKM